MVNGVSEVISVSEAIWVRGVNLGKHDKVVIMMAVCARVRMP